MPTDAGAQPSPLFSPLRGNASGMTEEQVAAHQRSRLFVALIDTVARGGYSSVRITELTRLAAVSNSTFYAHFTGKEDCFLAACEEIVAVGAERVRLAHEQAGGDWRAGVRAGFAAFLATLAEEPDPARFVLVDALSLGPRGVEARWRAMAPFERVLRHSLAECPDPGRVDDTTIHAIVAGTLQLVYRRLRHGRAEELEGLTDALVDWVAAYQAAAAVAPLPARTKIPPEGPRPPSPLQDPTARFALAPRDRIELAITVLVERDGYQGLSIPAISALAGVSNQTFYRLFAGKEDAFLSTFDEITEGARRAAAIPFVAASTWPAAVGDALDGLLGYLGRESRTAPLPLMGIYTGPPAALDRADAILDLLRLLLQPGLADAGAHAPVFAEAIAGGLWGMMQEAVAANGATPLRALTPQLTYLALVPFLGAAETMAAIGELER